MSAFGNRDTFVTPTPPIELLSRFACHAERKKSNRNPWGP